MLIDRIDLANYGGGKSRVYLQNYERELGDLFDEPIALLELGVQRGGSMRLWRDLLPNAQIAGLDLNPVDIADDTGRLHVYTGFQQDPTILDRIAGEVAPGGFDVIIDDASHIGRYTVESFWHLFPRHLKPGGVYVLEDWALGYFPDWADGHAYTSGRAALGDSEGTEALGRPSRVESLRRGIRAAARPVAARFSDHPELRAKLERIYMKAEAASMNRRFASHDHGMVGVVKQLVDACGHYDIDHEGAALQHPERRISSLHVYPGQVFVHKQAS